jgi:3-oxoacyl-[acyl-carrier-protein] synthase II
MDKRPVAIVAADLVTAYGKGIECCWQGMLEGRSVASEVERFSTEHFISNLAATAPGINPVVGKSLIEQMFDQLEINIIPELKKDSWLFLATTVGEIDLLENALLNCNEDVKAASQLSLLKKSLQRWHISEGRLVNAACASATIALIRAAAMIEAGKIPCALVVAADCVSEFVFSGFSALGAMSSEVARPFNAECSGLTLGEAAGGMVLMDADLAVQYELPILAMISGWGMSCDAKHMTAPDEAGCSLTAAINKAFAKAGINSNDIGGIMAHGTGTVYNDAMELQALKNAFTVAKPMFSTKFGTGHTLGAAGLIQAIMALKVLDNDLMPPQGNLVIPMAGADNWLSSAVRTLEAPKLLSINAGFGGINAALIIRTSDRD